MLQALLSSFQSIPHPLLSGANIIDNVLTAEAAQLARRRQDTRLTFVHHGARKAYQNWQQQQRQSSSVSEVPGSTIDQLAAEDWDQPAPLSKDDIAWATEQYGGDESRWPYHLRLRRADIFEDLDQLDPQILAMDFDLPKAVEAGGSSHPLPAGASRTSAAPAACLACRSGTVDQVCDMNVDGGIGCLRCRDEDVDCRATAGSEALTRRPQQEVSFSGCHCLRLFDLSSHCQSEPSLLI